MCFYFYLVVLVECCQGVVEVYQQVIELDLVDEWFDVYVYCLGIVFQWFVECYVEVVGKVGIDFCFGYY